MWYEFLIALLINQGCPHPPIHFYSMECWSDLDSESFRQAIYYCQKNYKEKPCIKYFARLKRGKYEVDCY